MAESAARITKHMNACGDAVTEIDSIKDGSHPWFGKKDGQGNAYYDQKHYNMHVWDNLNHLKLQQEQQWYKDDSEVEVVMRQKQNILPQLKLPKIILRQIHDGTRGIKNDS